MRTWVKVGLGIATLWPILFCMVSVQVASAVPMQVLKRMAPYGMASVVLTGVLIWALLFFYLRHLSRNQDVPAPTKTLWQVALVLGLFVTMPIYWYKFIWRKDGH